MTYFFDCLMHNVQKMLKYVNKTKFLLPMLIIIICTQILRLQKKQYSYQSQLPFVSLGTYTNGCTYIISILNQSSKECNLTED